MASPVLPADFKGCITSPGSGLCSNFLAALVRLPILIYKFFNWALDSSGNFTPDFLRSVRKSGDLIFSAAPLAPDTTRLLCDGSELQQSDYPALYAAIGAIYGTPVSSTGFLLPDYRAKFPVGVGSFAAAGTATLAVSGGEDQHILTAAEIAPHTHQLSDAGVNGTATGQSVANNSNGVFVGTRNAGSSVAGQNVNVGANAGNGSNAAAGHNTLPPFLPCYIYIAT